VSNIVFVAGLVPVEASAQERVAALGPLYAQITLTSGQARHLHRRFQQVGVWRADDPALLYATFYAKPFQVVQGVVPPTTQCLYQKHTWAAAQALEMPIVLAAPPTTLNEVETLDPEVVISASRAQYRCHLPWSPAMLGTWPIPISLLEAIHGTTWLDLG
jgi:hypothetical protein